jgi:hypothetical protein
MKVFKLVYHSILHILTYLINLSLETGHVPDDLKIAKVIPIFKKGIKTSIKNYRPISILSCFSKIVEKVVKQQLIDFIEEKTVV